MLMKLIGAVCIIVCCGFIGFKISYGQKKEEHYFQKLMEVLEFMMRELQHKNTTMPYLFYRSAEITNGSLKKIFLSIYEQLNSCTFPDLTTCINYSLRQQNSIPESVKEELYSLGPNLCSFNLSGQIKGISAIINNCEFKLQKLRNNKEQRLRTYQTLGLCAGAAIVIIFI